MFWEFTKHIKFQYSTRLAPFLFDSSLVGRGREDLTLNVFIENAFGTHLALDCTTLAHRYDTFIDQKWSKNIILMLCSGLVGIESNMFCAGGSG